MSAPRKRPPPAGEAGEEGGGKKSRAPMRPKRAELFAREGPEAAPALRERHDFTFRTFAKGRWLGRALLEVLAGEFQSESREYYDGAIKSGRITVNGQTVSPSYIFKNEDLMAHHTHRHEPPITAEPLTVLFEDVDIVVVNKPGSVPVHATGRYRHNTVLGLLGRDRPGVHLAVCHRLDRLTSGVLIVAKNPDAARRVNALIMSRTVQKEYICRVDGCFPEGQIICEEPIRVLNKRLGVCHVDPDGKPSRSIFSLIRQDATSSVVLCRPETGRMHQLRVHLSFLGHPIVNDPLYGASKHDENVTATEKVDAIVAAIEARHAQTDGEFSGADEPDLGEIDPLCFECTVRRPDPLPEELYLCLHAHRYAAPEWEYTAPAPSWAAPDYTVPAVRILLHESDQQDQNQAEND